MHRYIRYKILTIGVSVLVVVVQVTNNSDIIYILTLDDNFGISFYPKKRGLFDCQQDKHLHISVLHTQA